jgi:atypical dual specificity phosphatase
MADDDRRRSSFSGARNLSKRPTRSYHNASAGPSTASTSTTTKRSGYERDSKHVNGFMQISLAPYLYLGPRTSTSPALISASGITHVLSIGRAPLSPKTPGVTYLRVALSDEPQSSIERARAEAEAFIADALVGTMSSPVRILVHCVAAVSRSPTIVAAHLMKQHDVSLRDALGTLVRNRPAVCPNAGFVRQLKDLEIALRGASSLQVDWLPTRQKDRLALFQA